MKSPRIHLVARGATIRFMPKPSRNDICLCGSGKKYKKCCGLKQELAQQKAFIDAYKNIGA